MYVRQKGPADVGLLLHHCESTYSVWSRNDSVQRRVAGAGSNRKREWNSDVEWRGGEEKEKEESTVSPECIDSTVAQFSLLLLPLFTFSSDPSHFLALLVYSPPSLACYLCLPLTSSRIVFLSSSLFVPSRRPLYEFIGHLVATHPRFNRVTIIWKWFRKFLKLHMKKVLKYLHCTRFTCYYYYVFIN